jgi:hypothetical protein
MDDHIDFVDLDLPPGTLTKVAAKHGLMERLHEDELMTQVK